MRHGGKQGCRREGEVAGSGRSLRAAFDARAVDSYELVQPRPGRSDGAQTRELWQHSGRAVTGGKDLPDNTCKAN